MYWAINETGTTSVKTGLNVNTLAQFAQDKFSQCSPGDNDDDEPSKLDLPFGCNVNVDRLNDSNWATQ